MSSAAAIRVAKCVARKRAGLAVLSVEVELGPLADQLVEDKFLAEWDSEKAETRLNAHCSGC